MDISQLFLIVAGSNFDIDQILGNDNLSISRKWIIVFGVCQEWNKFVDCMISWNESCLEPINHWAYWPSSLPTIKSINLQTCQPSSLATIEPIDHWTHWPSSLSTSCLLFRLLSLLACFITLGSIPIIACTWHWDCSQSPIFRPLGLIPIWHLDSAI